MKFICPHCKEKSISSFSKFGSYANSPAKCPCCNEYSSEPTIYRVVNVLLSILPPVVLLLLSIQYQTAVFWFFWLIIVCLFPFVTLYYVELSPLEKGAAQKGIQLRYLGYLIFVIFVVWAVFSS